MTDKERQNFLTKYVRQWMVGDIEKCVKQGANLAAATLIFCGVDFLGGLLGVSGNRKRFEKFMKQFFDSRYHGIRSFLYRVYRCGLVHEYFPKAGAGIVGANHDKNCHLKLSPDVKRFLIHLGCLVEDFNKAIDAYSKELGTDRKLQQFFDDRMARLKKEGEDKFNKIKKSVSQYSQVVPTSCSTWTTRSP